MKIICTLLATAAVLAATGAEAQTSHFTFSAPNLTLAFDVATDPTPALAVPNAGFIVPATGMLNGAATTFSALTFLATGYPSASGGGGFSFDGSPGNLFHGAQLYSGTESAPAFIDGTYTLTSASGTATGTLQITGGAIAAVPEPASWAVMVLGLGAVGVGMRRRRTVTTRVAFV